MRLTFHLDQIFRLYNSGIGNLADLWKAIAVVSCTH
jgi:hypothetical protein